MNNLIKSLVEIGKNLVSGMGPKEKLFAFLGTGLVVLGALYVASENNDGSSASIANDSPDYIDETQESNEVE